MKFTTRTTYGLRGMIRLAQNYKSESMSLATIAKEEGISANYLERLFSALKKDGLVSAEKGVSGGYSLVKDPQKITVFDIIKSLEGKISPFHCLDEDGKVFCNAKCNCGVVAVLGKVQKAVNNT